MLTGKKQKEKTHEQLLEEAIAQIPIYSKEWSNYNLSDPGITMLENLSAFAALQQDELNQVTDEVRFALLKMAGFTPKEGQAARVLLLEQGSGGKREIPMGQKVYAQDICYEFVQNQLTRAKIKKICRCSKETQQDLSALLLEFGVPGGLPFLDRGAPRGQKLRFYIEDIPGDGQDIIFYVEVQKEFPRNPLMEGEENPFVRVEWKIYTRQGYVAVPVRDLTHGFLFSGPIHLKVPREAVPGEEGCYLAEAEIIWEEYDIPPKIRCIRGLMNEAVQMDTKAALLEFPGTKQIEIRHYLEKEGQLFVYGLEPDGFYYEYKEAGNRTYRRLDESSGSLWLELNPESEDKIPQAALPEKVLVILYSQEMLQHRCLGTLYGYDRQQLDWPLAEPALQGKLTLLASKPSKAGIQYSLVHPGEGELKISYKEAEGKLVVEECGGFEGALLYLAECSVYRGREGNVLPQNTFWTETAEGRYCFENYDSGAEGRSAEGLEELKGRFQEDLDTPRTLVTREDCETLVKQIPGLSIHKVRAAAEHGENTIRIVIKPNSQSPRPKLSQLYIKRVQHFLEERRMLTAKILVEQPVHVPIDVSGIIYVKPHYENSRETIEALIREKLDFVSTDRGFGGLLSYAGLYRAIEGLECVGGIYELKLIPSDMSRVSLVGMDIRLRENCLCYPGLISLELSKYQL